MFLMNYLFIVILVFLVFSVVSLGASFVPYHGVIALMGVSFFCCLFMVVLGRIFAALVMYIVYLGGLVVVFGYCVSIEKDKLDVFDIVGYKYVIIFVFSGLLMFFLSWYLGGVNLLLYFDCEDLLCLEVNGGAVFYFYGGVGLIVCSWGLLVVLFSILIILSWSRLGGLRPF